MAQQTKKTVTAKPRQKKDAKRVAKTAPKKAGASPKVSLKKVPAKPLTVAKKVTPKPVKKQVATVASVKKPSIKTPSARVSAKNRFSKEDLKHFQLELLITRERITDQSGAMKSAALQRTDEVNLEEEGTDAFMRLQTLEQVGTQQGIVIKINEALDAIAKGTYGLCANCNELISKARLNVLPFARTCIKCQAEMEQTSRYGRRR